MHNCKERIWKIFTPSRHPKFYSYQMSRLSDWKSCCFVLEVLGSILGSGILLPSLRLFVVFPQSLQANVGAMSKAFHAEIYWFNLLSIYINGNLNTIFNRSRSNLREEKFIFADII
jgi:hypothetical protein